MITIPWHIIPLCILFGTFCGIGLHLTVDAVQLRVLKAAAEQASLRDVDGR